MKKSLYLAFFLAVVGSLSALLITAMFDFASPILAAREQELIEDSMRTMFKELDAAESILEKYDLPDDSSIKDVYLAKKGNEILGIVYKTVKLGRNADITMLVGIDLETDSILDLVYLSQAETKGIGDRILDESYVASIVGNETNSIDVDLIAGATYSSTAVKEMVEEVAYVYESQGVGEMNE